MKVLIVDDCSEVWGVFRQYLVMVDGSWSVAEAACAEQGLDVARSCNLVITDLRMTGVGGLAFIRCLREEPQTTRIPIVAVSGEVHRRQSALDAGADAFLGKPFSLREFRHAVEALVGS